MSSYSSNGYMFPTQNLRMRRKSQCSNGHLGMKEVVERKPKMIKLKCPKCGDLYWKLLPEMPMDVNGRRNYK